MRIKAKVNNIGDRGRSWRHPLREDRPAEIVFSSKIEIVFIIIN